jgi:hypothetical protein
VGKIARHCRALDHGVSDFAHPTDCRTPPLGTSKINNYRVARLSVPRAEDATNNPATVVAFHQFAKRLGIRPQSVDALETSEANGSESITGLDVRELEDADRARRIPAVLVMIQLVDRQDDERETVDADIVENADGRKAAGDQAMRGFADLRASGRAHFIPRHASI